MLAVPYFLTYFLALATVTLGCQVTPGGTPVTKATFKFSISPPVPWTWNSPVTGIQKGSAADATKKIKEDVDLSVSRALAANAIPSTYVNQITPTYTPVQAKLATADAECTAGDVNEYVYTGNTVTAKCSEADKSVPFHSDGTLVVTSTVGLGLDQWTLLAKAVQRELVTMGCIFNGDLTIST